MMQLIKDLAEWQFDLDSESDAATKLENEKRKDELKLREKSTLFMKEKQGTPNCSSYNSSADIDMATVKRRRRPTFRALRSNREELLQYMNERDERAAKIKKIKLDIEKKKVYNRCKQIDMLQQIILNMQRTRDKQ